MSFIHMDPENILWDEHVKRFSKGEIIEMLREEKRKMKLMREIIEAHKAIIKQASQRLELSKHLRVEI